MSYPLSASVGFSAGDGSESNPYLIENAEQLDNIRNDLNAHYALINDVDVSSLIGELDGLDPLYNDGRGWNPIGDLLHPFKGSIDGRGHTISGLVFYVPESDSNTYELGLFSGLENALLYNMDVAGEALIEHDSNTHIGLIAPYSYNSTLSGLNVSGSITGLSEATAVIAGLIAQDHSSSFFNIDMNVSIHTLSSNTTGGVVGESHDSSFSNVVNRSGVHASKSLYVGGIVGNSKSSVYKNVRNFGDVSGYNYTGGIIGWGSHTTMHGVQNIGNVQTQTYHGGGIIGKIHDNYEDSNTYDHSLTFLLNQGTVTSFLENDNVRIGGLIGMMEFQDYGEDALLIMSDLIDLSTSLPLVGMIQENQSGIDFTLLLRQSKSTSNTTILTENINLGSIIIVDESTIIEPDDLTSLSSAINEQGYELEASNLSDSLIINFVMNVYLTQGRINGASNEMLQYVNTEVLKVLPSYAAYPLVSFEELAFVVPWDFTSMIGWNTHQQDTGDFFYPEDEFVYVSDTVFIRLFATDLNPDDVEEEPPVDEEESLVNDEEPTTDEEDALIDEEDATSDIEAPVFDEEELIEETVNEVDENESMDEQPLIDLPTEDENHEENEYNDEINQELLPGTNDSKSWTALLFGLGLLVFALSKKTKH
ncbi:MAG: hypothetical protein KGZ38_03960 [Erysipelothrix sp.]|nr:hypothetical protein [Erysipelothrix sp.]